MEERTHHKRWPELEVLLDEMMGLPIEERPARLQELAGQDPELHHTLQRLLVAMDEDDSFLERGAADLSGDAPEALLQEMRAQGARLGRYQLLKRLGSGGMAEVWLAERDDDVVRQKVAIKLLHPMVGTNATERFRSERHILGALRHDGIAKILDAGIAPGTQPYLVLEYVDGVPITDYCREHSLNLRARLNLFREICDAVGYAHRRLIVHRDLKPSNILVTKAGRVKLVDFGIAKLLDPAVISLTDVPMTKTGLFLMTPDYAAPEQIRGEAITTATDVYGLGVLLFELLAGKRPFDLQGKPASEVERIVCDTGPDKPSTHIRSVEDQGADIRRWHKRLRGDLDTIVLKAMRREPDSRYPSVQDLADDVGRYLGGRPVAARPATLLYRARKFVSRNRIGVAAAALVVSAVLIGIVSTSWQAETARREAERAQAVNDFLFELFEGADPQLNPGAPLTALDLLDAGAEKVASLQAGARAQVDMLRILGTLYSKLGEVEKGEAFLRQAVDYASSNLSVPSPIALHARIALAAHLAAVGDPLEAEGILHRLLASGAATYTVAARTLLGVALMKRGDYEQAETQLRMAVEQSSKNLNGSESDAAYMELGNLLMHQERWQEAEETLRQVARSREGALGHDHVDVSIVLWNLAELMLKTARYADAEKLHIEILNSRRRIYPNGHPDIARSLGQLGAAVQRQGRFEDAGLLYQQAVDAWEPRFGRTNPSLGEILANLAALRYRLGDFPDAVKHQSDALHIWAEIWGEQDDNMVAAGLNNLGVMYRELAQYDQADHNIRAALAMRRRLHGDSHATVGMSLTNLGRLRMLQGQLEDAERYAVDGLSICEKQLPPGHPALLAAQMVAGSVLSERGKPGEALLLLSVVAEAYETMLPPGDARLAETQLWLGVAKARLGDAGARRHLMRARQSLTTILGADAKLVERARLELVQLP